MLKWRKNTVIVGLLVYGKPKFTSSVRRRLTIHLWPVKSGKFCLAVCSNGIVALLLLRNRHWNKSHDFNSCFRSAAECKSQSRWYWQCLQTFGGLINCEVFLDINFCCFIRNFQAVSRFAHPPTKITVHSETHPRFAIGGFYKLLSYFAPNPSYNRFYFCILGRAV